jgi:hypothetical protein
MSLKRYSAEGVLPASSLGALGGEHPYLVLSSLEGNMQGFSGTVAVAVPVLVQG